MVGIDAAMQRYLGHGGASLSWAEAATLAILPNAPSAIHPSKNRDLLLRKRNRLLKRLLEKGDITVDEYEFAIDEPLIGAAQPMPQVALHLVAGAPHGQRTVTGIDFNLQQRLERLCDDWRRELELSGAADLAAVVVEVASGRVVAYVGNAGMADERHGRWIDMARAPRSSGSILKPLLFCAALQEGLILEETLLPDIPTDFGGFVPKNFDGTFAGMVPAREALALSLNVPNVWLLQRYGVGRFARLLKRCGMSSLNSRPESYGLSLVLGGAEVALLDVVRCYAALGRYDSALPLRDSTAIYATFDAMRSVERPDGLDWRRTPSAQKVAWKTGTSYGARDAWAVGLTPAYAVGVWVGNADGSGVPGLTGARFAGPVMFDIFNMLPQSGWFTEPEGRLMAVCRHSGHPAGPYCTDTMMRRVGAGAEGVETCPYCRELPVSLDGQRLVADASEPFKMQSYFVLPPVHKHYYASTHADYCEPPAGPTLAGAMKIMYPAAGAEITLRRGDDSLTAPLICKATHTDASAQLFWHLDGNYIATTTDLHTIQIRPTPGIHRLTILDPSANSETIEFRILAND